MLCANVLLLSVLLAATTLVACGGDDDTGNSSAGGNDNQPSSARAKSGQSLYEDPCGALSIEDVRTILPDATAGEGNTYGDSASCRWQSASKPAQAVVLLAVTLSTAQADAARDDVSKRAGQTKVDVGDGGFYSENSLTFFKNNVHVNLQYGGITVKQDSVVALGKKLAAPL